MMQPANTPDEVEAAFRHYFLTGPVGEDWIAWSQLFTDDATYIDHFWGTFHGPAEIQRFLEGTMSFAAHVYSPLVWYNIDGPQVVYKVVNRADNPEPGRAPIEFPSLQIIRYAGDGSGRARRTGGPSEMKRFNSGTRLLRGSTTRAQDQDDAGSTGASGSTGPARSGARRVAVVVGRADVPRVTNVRDMDFGEHAEGDLT